MEPKIGITYEELIEIYDRCGHAIKQPNSVKAIAGALNVISSRVYKAMDERIVQLSEAVMLLATDVALLKQQKQTQPMRAQRVMTLCYCGTPIDGPQCATCGRIQ